jgi:hypothetical protein
MWLRRPPRILVLGSEAGYVMSGLDVEDVHSDPGGGPTFHRRGGPPEGRLAPPVCAADGVTALDVVEGGLAVARGG